MKVTRFKRYVTWNIVSVIGYIFSLITAFFVLMCSLTSSNLNIRSDLNEYFYDYLTNSVIIPYVLAYKFLLFIVIILLIVSRFEHKYYQEKASFGLRLFENYEKAYSIVFVTGLVLNFLPMYIFLMYVVDLVIRVLRNFVI